MSEYWVQGGPGKIRLQHPGPRNRVLYCRIQVTVPQ